MAKPTVEAPITGIHEIGQSIWMKPLKEGYMGGYGDARRCVYQYGMYGSRDCTIGYSVLAEEREGPDSDQKLDFRKENSTKACQVLEGLRIDDLFSQRIAVEDSAASELFCPRT